MSQKIPIKSLEDIALGLIRRDNEAKKDYYNNHETLKVLEFELKDNKYYKYENKEEIKNITVSKREAQTKEEFSKSLKTARTLNSTNRKGQSNLEEILDKIPRKKSPQSNSFNKNKLSKLKDKNNEYIFKNKKLLYNAKLFFPLDYENVKLVISNCYFPLLQNFQSFENFNSSIYDIADKLEIYFNNDSFFTLNKKVDDDVEEFIEQEKIFELIEFSIVIFLLYFSIKNNITENNNSENDGDEGGGNKLYEKEINNIFHNSFFILQKLYENIILKLLFNENYNKQNKIISKNEISEKCINEFYIFTQKPKNNLQIIAKINDNIAQIIKGLNNCNKIILNYIKSTNAQIEENKEIKEFMQNLKNDKNLEDNYEANSLINSCGFYVDQKSELFQKFLDKMSIDQMKCYKIINYFFRMIISKISPKFGKMNQNLIPKPKSSPLKISSSLYKKIQISIYIYYDDFKIFLEKKKIKEPFLPPIDNKKFLYTLVLDLDETLVHYIEEPERNYVQVRPYAEYFVSEMGKYFELVIFTSAAEEYANIVLNEIDKNKVIAHKLYRRHVNYNEGVCLKDLNKLGRDIKKVCIIDNDKNNFKLHEDNGIEIKEFLGEQDDNELDLLGDLLMTIIESNSDDIRPIIKDIRNKMKKINEEKTQINNDSN